VITSELKDSILQTLASIPCGKVATYGQIAKLSGNPGYSRYVGTVLKDLPLDSTIPWHRVINSRGCISFAKDSDGYQRQLSLLAKEGITPEKGRISLKTYGWIL
jgi:methylated-DNA-protein-cysteine methyltransferase-like protein